MAYQQHHFRQRSPWEPQVRACGDCDDPGVGQHGEGMQFNENGKIRKGFCGGVSHSA